MKFSLILGPRVPLDRQTAWGCFTANQVGLPGLGSLAAGRRTGYFQVAFALVGLALTGGNGIKFFIWYGNNWSRLQETRDQPDIYFGEIWVNMRWTLLGFGVFLIGWLWALASSLSILAEARANPKPEPGSKSPLPPILRG